MCLDIFIDPVTLQCGHTACRGCLVRHFESLDSNQDHRQGLRESGAATCPLARCRIPFLVPEVNRTLRGAIESTHPERIAVRVSAGVPTPDSMQARINYLHARAAASGFGGLSLEDRRVVELERLRRMYAQGLRLLVARLPRMTRRWLRRETTLLATRCLRAAIAVYALALCFWFLGCPLWAEFCARRADARHVLAETTLAWLAVARLLLDWAVLGLCITVSRLLQSGFMSRACAAPKAPGARVCLWRALPPSFPMPACPSRHCLTSRARRRPPSAPYTAPYTAQARPAAGSASSSASRSARVRSTPPSSVPPSSAPRCATTCARAFGVHSPRSTAPTPSTAPSRR